MIQAFTPGCESYLTLKMLRSGSRTLFLCQAVDEPLLEDIHLAEYQEQEEKEFGV